MFNSCLGAAALCGGAMKSIFWALCQFSEAGYYCFFQWKHVWGGEKGVVFCPFLHTRIGQICSLHLRLLQWMAYRLMFVISTQVIKSITAFTFYSPFDGNFGKFVAKKERWHHAKYAGNPWLWDCCKDPKVQTLHHKYGLMGPFHTPFVQGMLSRFRLWLHQTKHLRVVRFHSLNEGNLSIIWFIPGHRRQLRTLVWHLLSTCSYSGSQSRHFLCFLS